MPDTRLWVLLGVVVLITLAGCGGVGESGASSPAPTVEPTSPTPSDDSTSIQTSPPTQASPDNPFEAEAIAVAVRAEAYEDTTRFEDAGQAAVDYWTRHSEAAGYTIDLSYTEDISTADVVIRYRPTIDACGDQVAPGSSYFYCGPVLERGNRVSGTQYLDVAGRYEQRATEEYSKAVLGRLLGVPNPARQPGLEQIDDPRLVDPFLGDGPVVVGLTNPVNDRNFTDLVERAVEYWEGAPDSVKNYSVDFVVSPDATAPDVEVRFTTVVEMCGEGPNVSDTLGCAHVLNTSTVAKTPEQIEIATGYTDETTLVVLEHEFGHLQGRKHDQEPMPLMAEYIGNSTRLPQPNATDRENPWRKTELRIFADYHSIDRDTADARDQVQGAVQYFRDHPAYRPDNMTFGFTSNRSDADIIITGAMENCDTVDEGSCHVVYGRSVDADPALEYYTNQRIYVSVEQEENIGWHVGTWLAYTLTGAESTEELPPAFDDPEHDDRSYFWR